MKTGLKRALALLLCLALALTLTACGQKKAEEPAKITDPLDYRYADLGTEPVTLNIAMDQGSSNGLNALAEAFMTEYPNVTVNIYYLGWKDLAAKVADPGSTDPVDGFMLTFQQEWWLETYLYSWRANCVDYKTTDIVDLSRFPAELLQVLTVEDAVYGLPLATSTMGMITNMDLLAACGVEKVPETTQELLDACEKIKQAGYTPFQCLPASFSFLMAAMANFEMQQENTVQAFVDTALDGTTAKIGSYYQRAAELLETLVQKGYVDFDSAVYNPEANNGQGGDMPMTSYKEETYAFLSGNVAFYPIYSDIMCSVQKREVRSAAFTANPFHYEMIPVPTEYGASPIKNASYSLYMCKNSGNYEWMKKFVQFVFYQGSETEVGNVGYFSDGQFVMSPFDTDTLYTPVGQQYYSRYHVLYAGGKYCLEEQPRMLAFNGYGICFGILHEVVMKEFGKDTTAEELVKRIDEAAYDWYVNGNVISD